MQKQVFYFCCFALPALWLTACEQGSDANQEHGELVPLSVNELTLTGETVTRVTEGVVNTDGAAIGVSQLAYNGYMPMYNCAYTYSATDGGWSSATPIYVDGRKAKIIGVYDPNNVGAFPASNTSLVSSTKLTAQAYNETKLWYFDNSNTAVNYANAAVAFKMKPAYSRIKLSIKRHATNYISGNCAITNVNLKSGTTFYADNALDISTGTPQGNAMTGGWSYNPNIASIAGGTTNTAYDVLVPPQPITAGLTITLTVDGKDRAVTIPAAKFTSNALAAGQQYTIELLITDTAVIPNGNVTITDYTTDNTNIKNDTPTEL